MRCVLEEHKDRTHKHLEAEQQARAIVEEERDAASQQAVSLKVDSNAHVFRDPTSAHFTSVLVV